MTRSRPSATELDAPGATSRSEAYVAALGARDESALRALFTADVDFRAMTPRRVWEATTPDGVADIVLGHWLSADYEPSVRDARFGRVGDREYLSYRADVDRGEGPQQLEQHAFLTTVDGRISWMRVLCSGYCARDEVPRLVRSQPSPHDDAREQAPRRCELPDTRSH